jgi:hypothetical protein
MDIKMWESEIDLERIFVFKNGDFKVSKGVQENPKMQIYPSTLDSWSFEGGL